MSVLANILLGRRVLSELDGECSRTGINYWDLERDNDHTRIRFHSNNPEGHTILMEIHGRFHGSPDDAVGMAIEILKKMPDNVFRNKRR